MENKLLSIVVPTKNRDKYLISFIELVSEFADERIEVVIQDNSTDNTAITEYLKEKNYSFIVYNYDGSDMSVVDNSNLAIKNSCGKFVCFMGDDDLISNRLVDFVQMMDESGYDSAIFNKAQYYWPGVEFKRHKFPNLIIKKIKRKIKRISVEREFRKMLKTGCVSLGEMPSLYHGVILRERLDEIYAKTGTFFPGPSPDMANTVALSKVVKNHIWCGLPLTTAGASPKSAAGLGAKHKHTGAISGVSFLPKGTEERWNELVPKVWTGPTIYAQSAYEALKAFGDEKSLKRFNYNYHYAFFKVFFPQHQDLLNATVKNNPKFCKIAFLKNRLVIFFKRAKQFLKNKIMVKLGRGADLVDGVEDTVKARRIIDEKIKDSNIERMFK